MSADKLEQKVGEVVRVREELTVKFFEPFDHFGIESINEGRAFFIVLREWLR